MKVVRETITKVMIDDENELVLNNTYIFITSAGEKTHGFNRVDDSPQIF